MIFTDEVKSKSGVLLVSAGQEVTISLLERIHNYEKTIGLKVPLWVMNSEREEAEEQVEAKEEEVVIGGD